MSDSPTWTSPPEKATILVVDDEPKIARLIRTALPSDQYEVLQAADGAVGVEMVESERPDLVLLDVMMPGMSGMETCKRIRELSDVPIIMLTARHGESDRVTGLNLGADDFVPKPFSPAELEARIRAVLRRARPDPTPAPAYDDGTLQIDFDRRSVTLNREPVRLTRTELRLLEVLARDPGRVFLHSELRDRVWGDDYSASSEQLRTYVRYLRRKIEPEPARPRYLLTRPGVGYVFRAPTARA
jgi:DNA-binding response OmpR family regulator